ncbi:ATP-phosphoribosyltransferase [gamma proteobacterium HdN1]|nr:ATP-phosphoribosyltransferase [gamma proteobacterium HdN1]
MSEKLTLALSKGRILKDTMPLLDAAGIRLLEDPERSRKLIFDTSHPNVQIVIIRASDVPTFVEHGAADIGVAGKDVLMEHGAQGLYELLDLEIARCKLMVAAPVNPPEVRGRLKVATKFLNITRDYYAAKGEQVELVKLYGSMELAPLVGLAHRIVDVVDTGNTLRANGLEPIELIGHVTSRLVVNKASMKMKHSIIRPLIDQLGEAVAARRKGAA